MKAELARAFHAYLVDQAKRISAVVPNFTQGGAGYLLKQLSTAMTYFESPSHRSRLENELDYRSGRPSTLHVPFPLKH